VELALDRDLAVLSLDATGEGLHRRGYRRRAGRAPLRETLAAALVLLSRWEPSRPLADPLCGSGTIAIEAALLALGLAPGCRRRFTAETWPHLPQSVWSEARTQARAREQSPWPAALSLQASDRDEGIVRVARENARAAGVDRAVRFRVQPAEEFRSGERYGCLICNPPYGERSGEAGEVEELYRRLGRTFSRLPDWSVFVLTGHPGFERLYGRRADRNRKLYNGNLKTYLYQFFGPLPPVGAEDRA
jgi:putative N6-adenine-specific DNA methylase